MKVDRCHFKALEVSESKVCAYVLDLVSLLGGKMKF